MIPARLSPVLAAPPGGPTALGTLSWASQGFFCRLSAQPTCPQVRASSCPVSRPHAARPRPSACHSPLLCGVSLCSCAGLPSLCRRCPSVPACWRLHPQSPQHISHCRFKFPADHSPSSAVSEWFKCWPCLFTLGVLPFGVPCNFSLIAGHDTHGHRGCSTRAFSDGQGCGEALWSCGQLSVSGARPPSRDPLSAACFTSDPSGQDG